MTSSKSIMKTGRRGSQRKQPKKSIVPTHATVKRHRKAAANKKK